MSDTTFTSGTVIASSWLNDVNRNVYIKATERASLWDYMTKEAITLAVAANSIASAPDVTAEMQAALNDCATNNKALFCPRGFYKISSQVTYTAPSSSSAFNSGIVLFGEGMGKTVFVNSVSSAPMLYVNSISPYFAKGNLYSDFQIVGDGTATSQVGIRSKGSWYTSFERIRINDIAGTAVLVGDSTSINPDTTANANIVFSECELDGNAIAIRNPVNNNAPFLAVYYTSIRNNTQAGIIANSSHVHVIGSSVSFNGLEDPGNARGGIVIDETSGTTFSSGYRSKDVQIHGCELDTNYPYIVDIQTAEVASIRYNSIKWEDYTGTAAADLAAWPAAQIRIGGTTNPKRVLGCVIEENRCSIVNNGNIAAGLGGHTILRIEPYGVLVKFRKTTFDMQNGAAVLGTDVFIIRETSKAGTSPDFSAPRYHVEYDNPILGANASGTWVTSSNMYDVPYRKTFASTSDNLHFQLSMADDTAQSITVPNVRGESASGSNYGWFCFTVAGATARSDLILYRATTSPVCSKLGSASTDVNVTTGVLAGTTGTDTKFTVSAHTDGKVYLENRLGATVIVNVSFLNNPGWQGQPLP